MGEVFQSPAFSLDAAAIKAFASEFDNQSQHVDEAAAARTLFGGLVASGWHTAAITMRLLLQSGFAGVSGRGMGLEVSSLRWVRPVRPGDSLQVETVVTDTRPSRSKPDRGVVVFSSTTRNQLGETVQELTSTMLVLRSDAVI